MPVATHLPATPQAAAPSARLSAGSWRTLALRAAGVLVVAAAAAAGLETLFAGSTTDAPPSPPRAIQPATAAIAAVPPAEAASFGVLRRARTSADDFAQIHTGAGPFGANPVLARTAFASAASAGALTPRLISVVPAQGHVCLRMLEATGEAQWWCAPTAGAALGELRVTLLRASPLPRPRSEQFVIGLVPDGIRAVEIQGFAGGGHKVAVHDNVYARATYAPRSVVFKLPGRGTVSYRVRA